MRAQALSGRRCTSALTLVLCASAVLGCHHETRVAYQPPPPPVRRPLPPPVSTRNTERVEPPVQASTTPQFDDTTVKPVFTEVGMASWYGPPYHNRAAADGSIFDQNAMTAAHRTLPMGSTLRVTNTATNQSVLVRVTDRGPFVAGRVLDLSLAAAKAIGVWRPGVAQVKIEAFPHASPDPAGKWCVQMGAFQTQEEATDIQSALQARYKTARVIEFKGPTGYWVRVNSAIPDLSHANEVARWLDNPDYAAVPFVVRLD